MAGTEFNTDQFQKIYPDGIENHYWNHARNRIILRFLKKYRIMREPVLEIGGGRGIVARFLHENQIDITGVELAEVNPVKGTEDYFFAGTDAFSFTPEKRMRFRVILLLDVIEHIKNPMEFIGKIIQYFPNIRFLLLTVPARQELWTNYDDFNGHFMRYNLKNLQDLSDSNIQLSVAGYFNHVLYPFFWVTALLIKSRETELKAPFGLKIALHRILSGVLQADYLLIPRKCPGTSAIALFRLTESS